MMVGGYTVTTSKATYNAEIKKLSQGFSTCWPRPLCKSDDPSTGVAYQMFTL